MGSTHHESQERWSSKTGSSSFAPIQDWSLWLCRGWGPPPISILEGRREMTRTSSKAIITLVVGFLLVLSYGGFLMINALKTLVAGGLWW